MNRLAIAVVLCILMGAILGYIFHGSTYAVSLYPLTRWQGFLIGLAALYVVSIPFWWRTKWPCSATL